MKEMLAPGRGPLPLPLARQIDQLCDRFEEEWLAGRQPCLDRYLEEAPPTLRPPLTEELLRLELEYRCRRGDRPAPEEYTARFPAKEKLILSLLRRFTRPENPAVLPAVPGYEILGVLGRGGMGIVYQARQIALGRPVALKMILAGGFAGDKERARFLAEAGAVARLRHPHIVQIYEVGEHEGRPFLSLEYVAGGSLAARLDGTPQPAEPAAALLETLARAMHHAHQQGIVHRDLKPANILLQIADCGLQIEEEKSAIRNLQSAIPKITDFGLAKEVEPEGAEGAGPNVLTQTGVILGTPSYMAPEQAAGQTRRVGPAADVYALGAILYEMLTGRPPFKAPTVLDTLEQVRRQEPVPPRRLQPMVPRDLEIICLKCLEKEPAARYASAEALADDLQAFREGRPILARPIGYWEQTLKWARRRPAVAGLILAVIAVSALSVGLVTWQWRKAVQAGQEAKVQRLRAEQLLFRFSFDRGQALCTQGDTGRGMLWLARTLETAPAQEVAYRRALRANLAAWRGRLHPLRDILPHPTPVDTACFSPDGRTIVTVGADNQVRLWDAAGGRLIGRPLKHPEDVIDLACSPDGRLVATAAADGKVRLWETRTGKPFGRPLVHGGSVRAVAFGAGGCTLVTGSSDKKVRLWETSTGRLLASADHRGAVRAVAVSPDGTRVLTGSADGTARLWDAATLQPVVPDLHLEGDSVRMVAFSPDGKFLLTVSRDEANKERAVQVWNAATGLHVNLPHHYLVRAVAFSPDGEKIATAGANHTAQVWDTAKGIRLGRPLPHQDTVEAVAFSPDGKTLLTGSADRTARLWDVATGRPVGQPLEHQGPVYAVAFSPDGRTLLTAGRDQTVRLWEPAAARPFLRELRHKGQVMALAWSPDGQTLVAGTDKEKAWRWEPATGKRLSPPLGHDDDVWVVAFSPDGRTILTGSRDRMIRLWDAWTGKLKRIFPLSHRVRSAAFSPDGRAILVGTGGSGKEKIRLLEVESGTLLPPALEVDGSVWQIAFSPNGKTCAIASGENQVVLWEPAAGVFRSLPALHQNRVVALAFSPDGRLLLTGSPDKTARLWDVGTAKPRGKPLQHPGAVWGVAFSADGRTLVTGSRDGMARLWDAATGMPIGPPLPHQGVVWAVACHPSERLLATASADQTVRLWAIPSPVEADSERLRLWVQVSTCMELDEGGTARWLEPAVWKQRRERLLKLGGPPLP